MVQRTMKRQDEKLGSGGSLEGQKVGPYHPQNLADRAHRHNQAVGQNWRQIAENAKLLNIVYSNT